MALPDPRKGERLILVTTRGDATRDALIREAKNKGASELMIPSEVIVVDKLPLLATGKGDYPAITELAAQAHAQNGAGSCGVNPGLDAHASFKGKGVQGVAFNRLPSPPCAARARERGA